MFVLKWGVWLTLRERVAGFWPAKDELFILKKAEQSGKPTFYIPLFQNEAAERGPRCPCRFWSPAKWTTGRLATCSCFQSKCCIITAASPGAPTRPARSRWNTDDVEWTAFWIFFLGLWLSSFNVKQSYWIKLPNHSSSPLARRHELHQVFIQ